jgi:hypothetical protein
MELRWRISTFSPSSSCVELADAGDGIVAVRNSNHREAGTLHLARPLFADYLVSIRSGALDDLV